MQKRKEPVSSRQRMKLMCWAVDAARPSQRKESACMTRSTQLKLARNLIWWMNNFTNKYSSESCWRDLSDWHSFAPFESNLKTTKSASGKRHSSSPTSKIHKLSWQIWWFYRKMFKKNRQNFAINFSCELCWNLSVARSSRKSGEERRKKSTWPNIF